MTIVTTCVDARVYGMTANAFMSGSLHPPLVVVSIGQHTRFHEQLATSRLLGISVLGVEQEHHSRHFSGRTCQPVVPQFEFHDGVPVVANALATVATIIVARHPCGDHTLFIGRDQHVTYRDGSPLRFFKGSYRELAGAATTSNAASEQWDPDWQGSWW